MPLEQSVSVAVRLIAGFFFVQQVAQFAIAVPTVAFAIMNGMSGISLGSSFVLLTPAVLITIELFAFVKSRALAQWIVRGA